MDLTPLELLLGSGALTTGASVVTLMVKSALQKKSAPVNGNGKDKLDTAIFVRYEAAHDHSHNEAEKLAEERFTNVYKKLDGMRDDMNGRLRRIENILDRRTNGVGDPAIGRRATD